MGPGPGFLDAPGQSARTVGAVVSHGIPVDAGVITADGTRDEVSAAAAERLAVVRPNRHPSTVDLDGLGRYRLIALHARGGEETIVTGLPLSDVDDTLLWVLLMFCVVGAVALIAATTAGIVIIRRQLAPLSRVSAAARQVADLELDRGEVRLPTPIVAVDPAGAHTEVGQLGSALNRMLDRIAGALSARHASETRVRQFVADASHELRTPLAAIRGYTELAQRKRDDLPDDVAHAMSRVESETERMTQLVEDMLLLARLDTGRPLQREPVDLSRLIVDAVSDAHIAGPDHRWSLDVPDEPVVIAGDEARLHQVLANLLANARTHTPAGTSVTTSLRVDARARRRADRHRRRSRNTEMAAAGDLRALRARRHVAVATRRQHGTRAGDRRRGGQGARRHHRRAQHCAARRNSSCGCPHSQPTHSPDKSDA